MDAKLNAGQLATGRSGHADSMAAEGDIPFGTALKYGTDPEKQVAAWNGSAEADVLAGVAQYSVGGDLDNSKYADGDSVTVARKAVMWVKLSDSAADVTRGDKVAVRDDGLFDKAPLSEATNGVYGVEIEDAEFKSAGSAGDVVKVEFNLPSQTTTKQL